MAVNFTDQCPRCLKMRVKSHMLSSCPKKEALSTKLSIKNSPIIITCKEIILFAPLECLLKFKTPNSDCISAQALITEWVAVADFSPMSLLHPTGRWQRGVRGRIKNKTAELRSFVFS